jgi:hypothetical protein
MKRLIVALILLAMPATAAAGTLFPEYIETGGYGSLTAKLSELGDGDSGFFLGAAGGLLLNQQLTVGVDVAFLMGDIPYTTLAGEDRFIEYTIANLRIGYIFRPEVMIHPALSMGGGLGWIKLRNPNKAIDERDPDADTVFQTEPMGHLILNLTKSSRLSLSAGYRWISGINTEDFRNQDAEGFIGELAISFGGF